LLDITNGRYFNLLFFFPKHTHTRDGLDVVYRRTMFTNQAPTQKQPAAGSCKRTWEETIENMDGGNTTTRYLTVINFNLFAKNLVS
jgi:hypothetical protein